MEVKDEKLPARNPPRRIAFAGGKVRIEYSGTLQVEEREAITATNPKIIITPMTKTIGGVSI